MGIATVLVDARILMEMCKPGPPRWSEVVENALPEDAEVVGVGAALGFLNVYGSASRIEVLLESASFTGTLDDPQQWPDPVLQLVDMNGDG